MDERIDLFLKGKMSKKEADEFREQLNNDDKLRERAITMAILLKSMKRAGAERDQEFINEIYDSKIDSYLKGKMSKDEVSEFKQLLERNEELRNRTISKAIFLKTLKKVGKEKDQEIIEKIKESKIAAATAPAAPTTPSRFTLFIRYTTAVAACICVLFYIDFQIAKNNIQTLSTDYLAYAPTFEGDGQFKGATDLSDVENELESIFEKIKLKKDIEENILALTELYNKSKSKTLNKYTNYIDYIGYYLAISHLQNNDKDMAINVLSELLVNNPDFEEANKLLNEIKKVKGLW